MVTTLYLIRHGETEGGEIKRYKGHIDVPLSTNGIRQMKSLSRYLQDTTLSVVYCSDLIRAIKSAEIIAETHQLKPVVMPSLRERNFGLWEGMSFDEIKEMYPQEFEAWAENPLKFSPMGGEGTIEIRDRVIGALDRILNEVQDSSKSFNVFQNSSNTTLNNLKPSSTNLSNIAIVSHGGVNRVILCHLLGIPLENIFRIEQDYGCVNIIEFWDKYPVVKLINGIMNG